MDSIRRFVFLHHRLLAAICTGLAVLAGLSAVRQSPGGVSVVVARYDLASGHIVEKSDVRVATLTNAPDHALTSSRAIGRRVAGPMRAGEPFTDYRVLRPDALDGYGEGAVLTSISIPDADGLTGLQVGDRIDVVAVDPNGESKAEVVARDVEVVTIPSGEESDALALGIVTTEKVALDLASAGLESRFTVMQSS
ncbi:Flp pilus assembly protein CpaB [Aeromicrobium panaciterrae]|uniref:Flp pilus assembly protein CpaB n=1 Tax=Aeromicrobium panaciterrae TaxID=363861 RepID=A0ABU1ULK4_9ACTN|nr:SAF domain-containing protein [Aeromicrobium panaciterrae]MDR7086051.1 Flp pilus assembly protein CpaB [Aeromicrobium panaciterrae]